MTTARCASASSSVYFRCDRLARTLAGNAVHLLTVTAAHASAEELRARPLVVLTARVHPGESNASWMMHGALRELTADTELARRLRERFVFKLVPLLNPDGVVNGSHRCSLAGVDLNRVWDRPSPLLHPEIFHAKGVVQYAVDVLRQAPFCIVDLHGHSRKSNVFAYGNHMVESWRNADQKLARAANASAAGDCVTVLPELLDRVGAGFSLRDCRFSVTRECFEVAESNVAIAAAWRAISDVMSMLTDRRRALPCTHRHCGSATLSF